MLKHFPAVSHNEQVTGSTHETFNRSSHGSTFILGLQDTSPKMIFCMVIITASNLQ